MTYYFSAILHQFHTHQHNRLPLNMDKGSFATTKNYAGNHGQNPYGMGSVVGREIQLDQLEKTGRIQSI